MTEENYQYRTSQIMLRNQFSGEGAFQIPIIPKANFEEDEFRDLRLIGFDRTHIEDNKNTDRMVHFFLYDYKFERVWKEPDRDIERLRRYRAVLSPDFSMYLEMNRTMQLYNTFRNRWCGAYFADRGMRVIPTVNWGDESTFDFCFLGIPRGSTVAVSTYMVSEHDNRADQKEFFLKGYREMLSRIEPERILCYHTPFPEMEGNIVYIDYDLSSWKYQANYTPSPYVKYITGELPLPKNSGIIIKRSGWILPAEKGTGSAHGGKWKPAKPEDERLTGKPGEIKVSYDKQGNKIETKIGEDGRASAERHHTSSPNPKFHSNPHDHRINWEEPHRGFPNFSKPINYWGEVPEFKTYGADTFMTDKTYFMDSEHFLSISEFKFKLISGNEILFFWNDVEYGVFGDGTRYCIALADGSQEKWCQNVDEVLEYTVGEDRLRDVITKVRITYQTL